MKYKISKIFERENKHLVFCLLFFVIPIILFGKLNISSYQTFTKYSVILLLSYLMLYIIRNNSVNVLFKIKKDSNLQIFILGAIFGGTFGAFHIEALKIGINLPKVILSIGVANIIYWVSIFGFIIFYTIYNEQKENNYLKDFNYDQEKIKRDKKINEIIN